LSDLGESKRIFLGRLGRHQGREREVVDEALAFAGEPTVENDNLHQPPHPTLLPERLSFARSDEEHAKYYEDPDISLKNDAIKSLGWREETEEEKDSGLENSQTCRGVVADVYIKNDQTECKGIFFKVLCQSIQRLQKPIVHALSFVTKTALVVASIATVAVLTTVVNSKLRKESMRKAHSSPSAVALSSPSTGAKKSANLVKLHDSLEGL